MQEIRRRCGMTVLAYQTLFFVSFLTHAIGQRPDFNVPENIRHRRFSWSTEAPLTRAINELAPGAIQCIDLMNRHMTRIEEAVLESLKRDRLIAESVAQPCNPKIDLPYRRTMNRVFAVRGLPEPAWNCGSDISGVFVDDIVPGYTLDDLYNAAFRRGQVVKSSVDEIAKRLINNFTRPEVPFNFTYNTVSAECVLTPVCMLRVGEYWHQGIGIHSHGRDDYVPDGKRNSIIEFFRVVNGTLGDNLLMRLPRFDNGDVERVFLENTTTMIQTWSRTPNPSCFKLVPIEENPAILEALDRVDHSAQQAEDALTSSNLAILLLPLGLNVVPIALFADVGTTTMLLYTLMSDILTVIPLAIKGTELVIIRSKRFRSSVTRVLSPRLGNLTWPTAAGGEIWAAECRVREEVGRTGVALIVLAVVFLVVGVSAEVFGRWFVRRRLRKRVRSEWWSESGSGMNADRDSLVESFVGTYGVEERYFAEFRDSGVGRGR